MSGTASPVTPAARSPPHRFAALDRSPSPRHARVANLATGGFHSFDTTDEQSPSLGFGSPVQHRIPSLATTSPATTTTVFGFSPPPSHSILTGTSPVAPNMMMPKSGAARPVLSPQLSSPTEPIFGDFPGILASSPRAFVPDLPGNRSRRNSAAVVSISLSSRSRSRTPRGSNSLLPTRSGSGPQSKVSTPKADPSTGVFNGGPSSGLADAWAPGVDDMDDWQPTGGVLLDADESTADSFSFDDDYGGRSWTAESEASHVADVLRPGMIFGEGLEFEGDLIEGAVGRLNHSSDVDLPLRRDGSQVGTTRGSQPGRPRTKKTYEVIRQLGSGSYAVVYLVRERGGRKREFALKCLSKHDLEEEQLETQLFEATIHLSLPIHRNIVTLHETLQTKNWLFLMLELCPGEDLFYWLERSRDASPPPVTTRLPAVLGHEDRDREGMQIMSSSRLSSSSIPFSSSQLFSNMPSSFTNSPSAFSPNNGFGSYNTSPASLLFAHHNGSFAASAMGGSHGATPPTPSLLSAFSANTLLTPRRLRLIASMFSQMCEAVSVCHDVGVAHRDIKPENFICCDSVELESVTESPDGDDEDPNCPDFGPQAKRKVIVKLTDFGLATTEDESGDVECGSKPYMSYECRNNLGPTYAPRPADVWSLGIVLINMLFHRNPWKDPTDGDPNFDTFLQDPVTFLQTKFTGIGREVATYLADRVLCLNVEDRITAAEFGKWIRTLPEMIAGRRAVRELKKTRLETRAKQVAGDKGLFVKSPVGQFNPGRSSLFTSALTSSAPVAVAATPCAAMDGVEGPSDDMEFTPSLATLPPASELAQFAHYSQGSTASSQAVSLANPAPTPDLDREEIRSATTIDDHPTPTDMSAVVSPEPTESGQDDIIMEEPDGPLEPPQKIREPSDDQVMDESGTHSDDKSPNGDPSLSSNHKRRKRGVRKGKAAQAAAAAAASGATQESRDEFLSELVQASEDLARDLSTKKRFDPTREADFPPLGTSPAQVAAARKSKWKELLSKNNNPQLEALARRVAERDNDVGGTWSAPAKLQQGSNNHRSRHAHLRQTATTMSVGGFSQLSIPASESSATSSMIGGPDDDDWRRPARQREEERRRERERHGVAKDDAPAGSKPKRPSSRRGTEDSSSRSRQAALAAAAIAGGLEPMGAFSKPSHLGRPVLLNHRPPHQSSTSRPSPLAHDKTSPISISPAPRSNTSDTPTAPPAAKPSADLQVSMAPMKASTHSPNGSAPSLPPTASPVGSTTNSPLPTNDSPSKPKIKGQMHGLAKMFGGLKTKGRD